jgi:hypothetical protein
MIALYFITLQFINAVSFALHLLQGTGEASKGAMHGLYVPAMGLRLWYCGQWGLQTALGIAIYSNT